MAAARAVVSCCRLMDLVCGVGVGGMEEEGGVVAVMNALLSVLLDAYDCLTVLELEPWVVGDLVVHVSHLHGRNFWDFSFFLSYIFCFPLYAIASYSLSVGWISPLLLFFLFFSRLISSSQSPLHPTHVLYSAVQVNE